MLIKEIDKIFQQFHNVNPNPKTELEYTNNFTLLVAVMLSAQATDVSVNKATKNLFKLHDTPEKFLELGVDGIKKYIKTIGLYNTKAKNIIAMSAILVKTYNSIVPDSFENLIKLPGVGRKTANVVLNCVFGKATIAVDTHVFRVARRIGLASGDNPEKVELELLKNIPKKWLKNAHHWLILHGRYVCKARTPQCAICPISKYCQYYNNVILVKKKNAS